MTLYRLRDVEAVHWSGSNWHEVYALAGKKVWVVKENELRVQTRPRKNTGPVLQDGVRPALPGMWVVRLDADHFKVYTDDVFRAKYEEVA